ncbi:hypothetical protein ABBQ32_000137 [Trebouxia sp. C0010 RCD-2024]
MDAVTNKPESGTSQSPAPAPNNHAEAPPGKPPKELKPWQWWFTILSLPVFVSMFLCAMLGVFVLTDQKQSTWLSQSFFGIQWRRLIDFNQVFSAGCLNGGLLGAVIAYVRLSEHQRAKQYRIFQSQFKVYKPSDLPQERKHNKKRRPENKKHR